MACSIRNWNIKTGKINATLCTSMHCKYAELHAVEKIQLGKTAVRMVPYNVHETKHWPYAFPV
jgi:hypothetical protein